MTEIELAHQLFAMPTAAPNYTGADFVISASAVERIEGAPAENTRIVHERDWAEFQAWCAGEGRVALPATTQTFVSYVTHLIETRPGRQFSPASIDLGDGNDPRHAHRPRVHGAAAHPAGVRRPVRRPAPVGRERAQGPQGDAHQDRRAPGHGRVPATRLRQTDQDAKGQAVPVLTGQHPETCPVHAVHAWTALLADRETTKGALFRPIDGRGRIGSEPGGAGHPRDHLTGHAIAAIVRRHALAAGLDNASGYTGHTLRSGGASSAYEKHAPVAVIADHGRCAERSPVVPDASARWTSGATTR